MFFTPDGADKLFDARGDVVVKPFVIHQRQDAVAVSWEGFVGTFGDEFGETFVAFMGVLLLRWRAAVLGKPKSLRIEPQTEKRIVA